MAGKLDILLAEIPYCACLLQLFCLRHYCSLYPLAFCSPPPPLALLPLPRFHRVFVHYSAPLSPRSIYRISVHLVLTATKGPSFPGIIHIIVVHHVIGVCSPIIYQPSIYILFITTITLYTRSISNTISNTSPEELYVHAPRINK